VVILCQLECEAERDLARELRPTHILRRQVTACSLFRTALPIGAFYLTEILIGLTDLAVVGALGTTELAALGLGKTILLLIMVRGFAVLAIVGAHASGLMLSNSGDEPELVLAFNDYAGILAWAIAALFLFAVCKDVLNAVETPGAIIWLSTGIVLGNLAASFALINGVGPWQGLSVAGAAWVTLGVNAVAAVALQSVVLQSGHVNLRGFDAMLLFASSPTLSGLGWASCAPRSIAR